MRDLSEPRFGHWLVLGAGYFALASVAIAATRLGNGVAILWFANALAIAYMMARPPQLWRPTLIACGIGSFFATGLFGFGWLAAPALVAANVIEVLTAAFIFRRLSQGAPPFESMRGFTAFGIAAALVAPASGALIGGSVAALYDENFLENVARWFAGHALGTFTFAPLFLLLLRGDLASWAKATNFRRQLEAVALLGGVALVSYLVFMVVKVPLLFLPVLPIILATFRLGPLGAAASIIILAVIGGYSTIVGSGPISMLTIVPETRLHYFQFYLAVTVLAVLPAAVELAWRKQLHGRLQESEARYRLLAENSTDIILNIDCTGQISFASASAFTVGGYRPEDVVGRSALDLIDPADRDMVAAAQFRAQSAPGTTEIVEYRGLMADGGSCWMESSIQAFSDESGKMLGTVSAVRNIEYRKAREHELATEADTDGLTGVLNRRAFGRELDRLLAYQRHSERGCLAIFDLDHFKRVNDTFGHAEGDRVLTEFIRAARATLRDEDVIGRLGGEEFAVLLKGAGRGSAMAVCERLRANFAMTLEGASDLPMQITVSAGVTDLRFVSDPAQALRSADDALYRAKRSGRNRLELAA